jgi:hypothetical protein
MDVHGTKLARTMGRDFNDNGTDKRNGPARLCAPYRAPGRHSLSGTLVV